MWIYNEFILINMFFLCPICIVCARSSSLWHVELSSSHNNPNKAPCLFDIKLNLARNSVWIVPKLVSKMQTTDEPMLPNQSLKMMKTSEAFSRKRTRFCSRLLSYLVWCFLETNGKKKAKTITKNKTFIPLPVSGDSEGYLRLYLQEVL